MEYDVFFECVPCFVYKVYMNIRIVRVHLSSTFVNRQERALWEKIYKKSGQGRRTGVGITAEGDMLAALGLRYGTEEATEFSEKVHKTVALGAYRYSVEMAKERGAFEIYNSERE